MSEAARPKIDEGFGGLTRWEVFVDRHLRKKDGSAHSDRNARLLARKHGFGLIRIGQIDFIDEAKEARRLRDEGDVRSHTASARPTAHRRCGRIAERRRITSPCGARFPYLNPAACTSPITYIRT